jgi:hypothetical protein
MRINQTYVVRELVGLPGAGEKTFWIPAGLWDSLSEEGVHDTSSKTRVRNLGCLQVRRVEQDRPSQHTELWCWMELE